MYAMLHKSAHKHQCCWQKKQQYLFVCGKRSRKCGNGSENNSGQACFKG